MKIILYLSMLVLTVSCSTVHLKYEANILDKKDNQKLNYIYEESHPLNSTRNWCIATGWLWGGTCWNYLTIPNNERKRTFKQAAEQEVEPQYEILNYNISRASWDQTDTKTLITSSDGAIVRKKSIPYTPLDLRARKIKQFIEEHPKYSAYESVAINKQVSVGMPEALLILSFGKPKRINESIRYSTTRKQLVYDSYYIYVENGVVESFQRSR